MRRVGATHSEPSTVTEMGPLSTGKERDDDADQAPAPSAGHKGLKSDSACVDLSESDSSVILSVGLHRSGASSGGPLESRAQAPQPIVEDLRLPLVAGGARKCRQRGNGRVGAVGPDICPAPAAAPVERPVVAALLRRVSCDQGSAALIGLALPVGRLFVGPPSQEVIAHVRLALWPRMPWRSCCERPTGD
jgi:hypothetical protein